MKIKYLGHSAFEIETNGQKILIDPFLVCVPNYNFLDVKNIFVTHAHGDHLGSAIEISKKTGATITAVFELANYCTRKGASAIDIGLGGWQEYGWGKVIAVGAQHSSSTPDGMYGGCPCGFIFEIENKRIYHAGDTGLSSEMKVIGDIYAPEIAMLPIGGKYTMDIEHALKAAEMIKSQIIIPMHYNTFDAIRVNVSDFEEKVRKISKTPIILSASEVYNA